MTSITNLINLRLITFINNLTTIIIKSSQPKDLVPTEKEAAGYAALDQAVLDMIGNLPADWKPGMLDRINAL